MGNGEVKASVTGTGGTGNALNLPIANPKAKAAIVKVCRAERRLLREANKLVIAKK